MSAVNTFGGIGILICTLASLIFVSLALGGGTWIEGIDNEGDFFTRASYTYKDIALITDGRLLSMGMWRYFTEPGVSAPLPFRDPELIAGTASYIGSMTFGCLSIFLVSFQILGVRSQCVALSLTVFWTALYQMALVIVGNSVVVYYFQKTFTYENLGHSHHFCWIAFAFCTISVFIALFKLYTAYSNRANESVATGSTLEYKDGANLLRSFSPPSVGGMNNSSGGTNSYKLTELDVRPPPPQIYNGREYQL